MRRIARCCGLWQPERRRFGYRRLREMAKRKGRPMKNLKKVYRLYREEGLDGAPAARPQTGAGHAGPAEDSGASQPAVTGISAPPRARLGSERYWRSYSDIGRQLGGNFHA